MKKLISALSSLCLAATSLLGAFPAITADNAIEAKAAETLVYNLIPNGKNYESAETTGKDNNAYKAAPGEELTIDWTIKGDPGTAGIQMNFDFTQVEYVGKKRGNAYRIVPTFSDYENTSELKKGECIYAWAQSEESQAEDNKVIYSFNIKTPQTNGTYTVGLGTLDDNKVIPIDQTKTIPFTFHGLDITVEGGSDAPAIPAGTIVYDLVPSGKSYTPASGAGKNNVYNANAGEELTIDWTIKNDQGTAGMEMHFDFTQVEYVSGKRGSAYRIVPTYSDSSSTSKLQKGECVYTWAQSEENKASDGSTIYSFNVVVPSAKGTYKVGLSNKEESIVLPVDQTKPHKFEFHGLDIVVSEGQTVTQAPPDGKTIIYNLVPSGKTYESAQEKGLKNNVYKATAGEELTIDWTIKNDQGTAGLQMNFDFTQVEYISGKRGNAYRIVPTYSDYKSTTNLKQGECIYTWAQSEENKANDDSVIYSFNVKVPSAEGTYSVGMAPPTADTANKAVPIDQTKEHKIVFYGLDIVVGDNPNPTTTAEPSNPDKLTYDIVPKDLDYTKASGATGVNSVTVKPGTEMTVEWYVKNDKGTAGLQMYLDFTKVDYVSGKRGGAYRIAPTFNDYNNAPDKMRKGEVVYTWAQSEENTADETKPIYSFTVKAPETEGTYKVGLDRSQENKAVPVDQDHPYSFDFHDLEIVVSKADVTTAEPVKTTAPEVTGTDAPNPTTTVTNAPSTTAPVVTTKVAPAGKAQWSIGEEKVGPGAPVKVPVKVTNDDGTSGFVVNFKYDGLTFEGISWADGYSGEATINNDKQVVVWANGTGSDESADGVIMYLNFIAPTKAGEYPVEFDKLEVTNTKGLPIEASTQNGKVIVDDSIIVGSTNWIIGTKKAAPGATVKVPVTVTEDSGTAGFVVQYNYDSKLKFNGIEWANGYEGEATLNDNKLVAVWASSKGNNEVANDVVMYLNFTAPAENGTYDVNFTSLEVSDTAQHLLNVTKTNGAVIVDKEIKPAGKTNWVIGKETVAPGAKAKVPVTVSGDEGTAGFVVMFKADSALKFDGFEWADGYTGSAILNNDQMAVVWANDKGADEKADGVVLYMNFTAPTANGEYPVEFTLMDVTNTDQQQLTVTKENGYVKVDSVVTTTITEPGTTTVTSTTLAPGKTGWYIGKKEAEPGKTVKVPVTVKGDTGTAGFVAQFAYDPKLTFIGYEWGDAYSENAELNKDEMVIVWAAAQGTDEKAADDAVVVNLVFTAPDEEGEYPVTFTDLEVVDTNQNPLDYVKFDGAVIVTKTPTTTVETGSETTVSGTEENPSTETTVSGTEENPSTETTVSGTGDNPFTTTAEPVTTTAPVPPIDNPGHVVYQIADVNADAGTIAKVPVYVWYDEGTSGFKMRFTVPDGFQIEGLIFGDAYTSDSNEYVWNGKDYVLVWSSSNGDTQKAADGAVIATLLISVPDNAEGKYDVKFVKDFTDVSGDGEKEVEHTEIDGSITVAKKQPGEQGNIVFNVGDAAGKPGDQVSVPLAVWFDDGAAEFELTLDVPDGFSIDDLVFNPEYEQNGKFTWDPDTKTLKWVRNPDSDFVPTPGTEIATIKVTIPEDAEPGTEYPIGISSATAKDKDGNPMKTTANAGTIHVADIIGTELTAKQGTSTDATVTDMTGTGETVTEATGTGETGTGETNTDVTTVSGTGENPGNSTTDPGTGTNDPTTTTTLPNGVKIVTSYKVSFTPPTRVNYWSHDTRSFKESGGLKDLAASLTIFKFYVNENNEVCDVNGNKLNAPNGTAYTFGENGSATEAQAFETKTIDISKETHPLYTEDSPIKVWTNEIIEQFGDEYTNGTDEKKAELELKAQHANKYPMEAYYHPTEQSDPDGLIGTDPIYLGDFNIYIGVKGDYNLDNVVSVDDVQNALIFYTDYYVAKKKNVHLNDDPELDGEDGLIFYLINVRYRDGDTKDAPLSDPQQVSVDDVQCMLKYYTEKYVALKSATDWEWAVGYDLLDSFYGDDYE